MSPHLEAFRALTRFDSPRDTVLGASWDTFVDWAISQGVGPLIAYNLEYRLGGASAPEWARDRLLSVYQGTLNDNVMKLVNFKRAVGELEGRRIVLLGAASFSEALYPHIAFRPVLELEALVPAADLDAVSVHLAASDFKRVPAESVDTADRILFDGRTRVLLYANILGEARRAQEAELLARALAVKVYGPSVYRLDSEDALLIESFGHAQSGYQVPGIAWVDFRELVLGSPSMGGSYSRAPDAALLRARARGARLERALWASLTAVEALFPETAEAVRRLRPELRLPTRALLERSIVRSVALLETPPLANARIRRLLVG